MEFKPHSKGLDKKRRVYEYLKKTLLGKFLSGYLCIYYLINQ